MSNTPLPEDELASILDELGDFGAAVSPPAPEEPAPSSPLASAAPAPGAADGARPYVFGKSDFGPSDRLTLLERMNDKLTRTLKDAVEPFARCHVRVTPQPVHCRPFADWAGEQPEFTSLSLYWLRPLKGGMLVAVEPAFVAGLVESFYGGGGVTKRPHKGGEFSPSEALLLRRLLDKVVGTLIGHWCEVTPVEAALAARETSVTDVAFLRPEEAVAVQRLTLGAGQVETVLTVIYPLAMVRQIEARTATRVHDEEANSNDEWRLRLADALAHVRLPVRSVLARPEISVGDLLALKPGDVIPIQLAPRTPLLAGSRHVAAGVIGEQDGRAALMIEKVGEAE